MVAPQGNLNLASFGNIVVPWGATKTPFYLGIFFSSISFVSEKII